MAYNKCSATLPQLLRAADCKLISVKRVVGDIDIAERMQVAERVLPVMDVGLSHPHYAASTV